MIAGLLALPWMQDAKRVGKKIVDPCETCMNRNPPEHRARMGCGYMSREYDDEGKTTPRPDSVPLADVVPGNEWCPGYTVDLPDVTDISEAYLDWERGISYGEPCRAMRDGLRVMHGSVTSFQNAKMRERSEGDGSR